MQQSIEARISELPEDRQKRLREWVEIFDEQPEGIDQVVDILASGNPYLLNPCRALLQHLATGDELLTLCERLGSIDDPSIREGVYWVVETAAHREGPQFTAQAFPHVAGALCRDIASLEEGQKNFEIAVSVGIYATVACAILSLGPLSPPENARPLGGELQQRMVNAIHSRIEQAAMGIGDPVQAYATLGGLFGCPSLRWLVA